MNRKKTTINLIQDRATPHNNVLIAEFKNNPEVKLNVWYAEDQDITIFANYPRLGNDLTNKYFEAKIYGSTFNFNFIKYCLKHIHERYVFVGWINTNTRLLHLIFFILRRPFNHWTDSPEEPKSMIFFRKAIRFLIYKLLNLSKSKVFVVGNNTKKQFIKWGIKDEKLVNLPIFITAEENLEHYKEERKDIFKKYSIKEGQFLISAGSRLIFEKGYDLLIKAISLLPNDVIKNTKVIIVGSGAEELKLNNMIKDHNLEKTILIEPWLPMDKFKSLIANSNLFIHPSRFDSFGGSALAMMLGVPVVGSKKAGAASERIVHGKNGFLYEPENIQDLSNYIFKLYSDNSLEKKMSKEAHLTALSWRPEKGRDILIDNAI
jgi:glycosyltransferase involved in cell wall biosynthesis